MSRRLIIRILIALMLASLALVFVTRVYAPEAPSPELIELNERADERKAMVADQIEARGVEDVRVLEAMRTVPRHLFVPEDVIEQAYADRALPIGYGQTISQPYIVGLMSASLDIQPGDRVLEIGTGSGYQAAVLAEMGAEVYTVEIVPELAEQAAARLKKLGYGQVKVLNDDGYFGWAEYAPYDAIIVTAAPDHLPEPLIGQLKDGGRLVIPIGPVGSIQTLWLFEKKGEKLVSTNLGDVVFVPFTRK
jgi:protein-L-isoaspartate(D-aspartate) O-methyltransferase